MSEWKSYTHTLDHPVTIGEQTVHAITLREPTVEALEVIDGLGLDTKEPSVADMRAIITALADQPEAVIRRLHRDDFLTLGEACGPLVDPDGDGNGLGGGVNTAPPSAPTAPTS